MNNIFVKTSKGEFQLGICGGGKDYEINKISECCLGYFILREDNTREYFQSINDVLIIREAYKNMGGMNL